MNRNLLIALALPSMMFYQSSAPILYSSEKLITQVKEEQAMLNFNLAEMGNTLIISNDRTLESSEASRENRRLEPESSSDQFSADDSTTDTSAKKEDAKSTEQSRYVKENQRELPKTAKKGRPTSAKKDSIDILETIEQKISALPMNDPPLDKKNEHEFVRMLASMSGTILYGTKQTEPNRYEYITF